MPNSKGYLKIHFLETKWPFLRVVRIKFWAWVLIVDFLNQKAIFCATSQFDNLGGHEGKHKRDQNSGHRQAKLGVYLPAAFEVEASQRSREQVQPVVLFEFWSSITLRFLAGKSLVWGPFIHAFCSYHLNK